MPENHGSPVSDIIVSYYDEQVRRLTCNYSVSIAAATSDSIHDLRVAIKRIRAFFELVGWLDNRFDFRMITRPIRKLFKAAGPVRDHHVQQSLCRDQAKQHHLDLSGYLNYLVVREGVHRERYHRKAAKFDLSALIGLRTDIRDVLRDSTDDELLFRMGQKFSMQIAEVIALTNQSRLTDEQRHQIRIATKAVRYTLEVRQLSSLTDASLQVLNEQLRLCHQALGRWHDYQVGCLWLTEYLRNDLDGSLVSSEDYLSLARQLRQQAETNLQQFESAWLDLRDLVRRSTDSIQ